MDRWKFVNEKWIPRPVSRGEGFVSGIPLSPSNLRPFGAPPSKGRREHPREPLPLEGAAERSEAGLASFFAAKPPPLCLPHWGRSGARVLSYIAYLRRSPLALFHTASTLSAPSGHLPHAGKALCRGQRHSHKCCASILRKQKPLCEDGLCRAVSGSIIPRSRILRDFSADQHSLPDKLLYNKQVIVTAPMQ